MPITPQGNDFDHPTRRQLMVIRFWGREDLLNQPRDKVSAWLDAWHADKHSEPDAIRHLCAWELFKLDNPQFDSGGDGKPADIPLGIGFQYTHKVAALEQKHGIDAIEDISSGVHPEGDPQISPARAKLIKTLSTHRQPPLVETPIATTPPPAPEKHLAPNKSGDPLAQGCLVIVAVVVVILVIIAACTDISPKNSTSTAPAANTSSDQYEAEQIARFGPRPTTEQATRIIYLYLDPKEEHFRDYEISWVGEAGRTTGGWCHTVKWAKRDKFGDMVPQKSLFFIDHGKVIEIAPFPDVTR